jgi:hypothetical protein
VRLTIEALRDRKISNHLSVARDGGRSNRICARRGSLRQRATAGPDPAVEATVRQVTEIAASSEEMAGGARSVTGAMQSISAVVEENTAATEQMAAQAGSVTGAIQSIAVVSKERSAATEEVSASAEEMSARSRR